MFLSKISNSMQVYQTWSPYILQFSLYLPCQDIKFHELLLVYDPSLKDTSS